VTTTRRAGRSPGSGPGVRPGAEHGRQGEHGETGGGPLPGIPDGFCQVPTQGEIGSLIAVTAAANLMLAARGAEHRRAGHQEGSGDRRRH
jgi:hypothetical protein